MQEGGGQRRKHHSGRGSAQRAKCLTPLIHKLNRAGHSKRNIAKRLDLNVKEVRKVLS